MSRYTRANLKALCLELAAVLRDVEQAGMPAYGLRMLPKGELRCRVEGAIERAERLGGVVSSRTETTKDPS